MSQTSNAKAQTVVVLGGGIGGIAAANRLRRRLDRRHRIVLVNRDPLFSFAPSYLWVMTGTRTPAQISRPLHRLRRRGIDVVIGEIDNIDPTERTVTVDGRSLAADHLVVALGADQVPQQVPGLPDVGHTFATLDGAAALAAQLDRIHTGRLLILTAAPLYRCPAAPYEAALLIDAQLRRRGVRDHVQIAMHSAEPKPMGVAGPDVSAAVVQLLTSRGIDYRPEHQISAVEPGKAQFSDGSAEPFDLLVYMPPIAPPAALTGSLLAGTGGWADADRATLQTAFDDVYAIGDNTHIPLTIGKPLPRAGVFAHAQAHAVADRIAAGITGTPTTAAFDGHGACFVETGRGRSGYGVGNFYAEPAPAVRLRPPARRWHLAKVAFEQRVLRRWL
jgi:sulfide:quinone oxidoreductase